MTIEGQGNLVQEGPNLFLLALEVAEGGHGPRRAAGGLQKLEKRMDPTQSLQKGRALCPANILILSMSDFWPREL